MTSVNMVQLKEEELNDLFEAFEVFDNLYCQRVKWIERLTRQDYTNFQRIYLIPGTMLSLAKNEISILHGLVLLARKRSLKDKQKEIHYHPKCKERLLKTLFLVHRYLGILRFKNKIFEELKKKKVVIAWREFMYLVFYTLVQLSQELDESQEFEDFKGKFLPFFLDMCKMKLVEDSSCDGICVKVKEEVR